MGGSDIDWTVGERRFAISYVKWRASHWGGSAPRFLLGDVLGHQGFLIIL